MSNLENANTQSNVCVIAKDKYLRYIYCNENYAALTGNIPNYLIGKTDCDLFTNAFAANYQAGDRVVLAGDSYLNVRETFPALAANIMILVSKSQIKDKFGSSSGIMVSFIPHIHQSPQTETTPFIFDSESQHYKLAIGSESLNFTPREYQVLKNILMGFTAKQIGRQLNLSFRTVEDYTDKIKRKLQCTSKYHIAETAMRLGIVHQLR